MSSTTTTTNNHGKTNKNLFSKMFGNKLNPTPDIPAADESASTTSGATLVQGQPIKPMSKEEQTSFSDLMAKANTMPPEEFKAYLARHKEELETAQRKYRWEHPWEYSKDFVNNEML
jgi:hypothetical protein